jgi:glycosyltransferase involved in cell wall biosynthesis
VPLQVARAVTQPKLYQSSRNGVGAWWFTHLGETLTRDLVDYYLPNSQDVALYLSEVEHVPRSKLRVILNGVDVDYFLSSDHLRKQGRRLLGLDEQAQVIVNVGPFKCMKRQTCLAKAALDLMPNFPDLHVAFVGKVWSAADAAYAAEVKALAADAPGASRFLFTGELSDVRPVLAAADLYAHPSLVEGSSNAVLEAMSMGLPCVVADIPSCRELVGQDEAGRVVAGDDYPRWAAALRELLVDDVRRAQLGVQARRRAEQVYSVQRMCREIEAVYRQGLAAKNSQ